MDIGLYIKQLRLGKSYTLHQVAIGTNIDATLLSKIERGSRFATIEQLTKIAQFFDIPLKDLQTRHIAEKIVKEYGLNEMTLQALQIVQEQFDIYQVK